MAPSKRKRVINPLQDLQAVVDRARAGDATVLPELQAALDEHAEVWKTVGDLNALVTNLWLQAIAGRDLLARDCIARELNHMRRSLRKTCQSALEKQLVENVVLCHLQLRHAELLLAAVAEGPQAQQEYYARRVAACYRRYTTAVGQLLKARELLGKGRNGSQKHKPVSTSRKAAKRVTSGSLRVVAE